MNFLSQDDLKTYENKEIKFSQYLTNLTLEINKFKQ